MRTVIVKSYTELSGVFRCQTKTIKDKHKKKRKEKTSTINPRQQNHKNGKFVTSCTLCVFLSQEPLLKSNQPSKMLLLQLSYLRLSRPTSKEQLFTLHCLCADSSLSNCLGPFTLTSSLGSSCQNSTDSRWHISLNIFALRLHMSNPHKEISLDRLMLSRNTF